MAASARWPLRDAAGRFAAVQGGARGHAHGAGMGTAGPYVWSEEDGRGPGCVRGGSEHMSRDPARAKARQFRRTALVAVTGTALLLAGCNRGGGGWWPKPTVPGGGQASASDWTMSGKDINNSRNASTETKISAATASNLKQKWAVDMKGDVSASPAVVGDVLYVPDFGGYLSAINAKTGAVIWQKSV